MRAASSDTAARMVAPARGSAVRRASRSLTSTSRHRRQRRQRGARRCQLPRLLELHGHGVVVARARRQPAGVSSATMRPRAMMMARLHTASTSSRMCVEITMILSRAISLISVRTSCFWFGIEAVGGLIEDQHRRIVHDRLRQAHAAAEALGQGVDGLLEHGAELQVLDDVVEAGAAARALECAHVGDEVEEAAHRHLAVAGRALGQVAEGGLGGERLGLDVVAADAGACRRWAPRSRPACAWWWSCPRRSGPRNPSTSPGPTSKLTSSTAVSVS